MKILSKLAVVLTFAVMMSSNFQSVEAYPKPGLLIDTYKQIPISIPKQRGSDDVKFNLMPQPGFNVTLMMNQTVNFAWKKDETIKTFVIKDDKGKKVFERKLDSANEIDIVPSSLKLKAGQKYSWSLKENSTAYKFTVLDAQTEKEILENLAEIDAENISAEERAIRKAIYVQMLSDLYPDTIDLYWLSAQWLSKIPATTKELEDEKYNLLNRCAKHLNSEMR